MGDEGTEREDQDRHCTCGHLRDRHVDKGTKGCCYFLGGFVRCPCLHFVPKGLTLPTIGPDHPLRQRGATW